MKNYIGTVKSVITIKIENTIENLNLSYKMLCSFPELAKFIFDKMQ